MSYRLDRTLILYSQLRIVRLIYLIHVTNGALMFFYLLTYLEPRSIPVAGMYSIIVSWNDDDY